MEICIYCGEPSNDKLSCCGENHWEEVEECPDCNGEGSYVVAYYGRMDCPTCGGDGYIKK